MRPLLRTVLATAAFAAPLLAGFAVPASAGVPARHQAPPAHRRPAARPAPPAVPGRRRSHRPSGTVRPPAARPPAARPPKAVAAPAAHRPPAAPPAGAAAPVKGGPTAVTSAPTRSGYAGRWGLFAPDFPGRLATIDTLQSELGRRADYIMWYVHWAGPWSAFNAGDFSAALANGSTPVLTWMSDDPTGATTITDADIAAGRYDSYINSFAYGLKDLGRPVLLRFDHEMNGDWYGWDPGVNGNTAAGYVAAWRHVHDLFAAAGASNVTFVWSPNVAYTGSAPLAPLYPGDAYVGMVGVDGYNWGTVSGHVWQTPEQVFGTTFSELASITSRPLMIAEVGCSPVGGNKAQWITQFFQMLSSTPAVTGFVWFDADKETDWRIDSSTTTLKAFRTGLTG